MEINEKPPLDNSAFPSQPLPPLNNPTLLSQPPPPYSPQYPLAPNPVPQVAGVPVATVLNIPPGAAVSPPLGPGTGNPLIVIRRFESRPMNVTCSSCGATGISTTKAVNGSFTWLSVGFMICFGCWCGCCLIPLCINGCRDIEHYCSQCKSFLGVYRRM